MLIQIPIGQLAPHPANREFSTSGVKWSQFVASVEARGVVQPLMVRPLPAGGWQIISGHRRAAAAEEAGVETLWAFERAMSDREALEWILLDNLEREDLDPVEEARSVRALIQEAGLAPGEVAASLKRSLEWVETRQFLLDLPGEALEALRLPKDDDRHLFLGTAQLLLGLPEEDRPAAVQLVLHPEYEIGTLKPRQAADVIRKHITEPKRAALEWEAKRVALAAAWKKRLGQYLAKDRRDELTVQALTWEECQSVPPGVAAEELVELAALTPDAPEACRWVHLAVKYGVRVFLVPDDGQEQSKALVDLRLIRAGEESNAEHGFSVWLVTKARGGVVKENPQLTRAKAAVDGEPEHPEQTNDAPEAKTVIEQTVTSRAVVDLGPVRRLQEWAAGLTEEEWWELAELPAFVPPWAQDQPAPKVAAVCEWVLGLRAPAEG